jgi:CheY-like chemotaxis protein
MVSPSAARSKILVIDDNADVTTALKAVLELNGARVTIFNDPVQAVKRFRAREYDLVLLDFQMPDMDGFEVYRHLKKVDDDVRVCLLTSFDVYEREFATVFPGAKIHAFLKKPVETRSLLKIVNALAPEERTR